MAHYAFPTPASARPTLPPLHTLDLPRGKTQLPRIHELYDLDDLSYQTSRLHLPDLPYQRQTRQVSVSSSTSSRTPSPTPSPTDGTIRPSIPMSSGKPSSKMRLIPTTLENADAVVVIPPADAQHIPPLFGIPPTKQGPQTLLLVGPALQYLRHPQRRLAKGARVHPYRIVRGPTDPHARRTSIINANTHV
ncbi:hypothetical protein F5I97DRAFT_1088608 [Phlebopus sp. FC_14]|nr:hypothetical protein F5I97DRAFT_1088608 [Phlebopus sp. FC_14]